MQTLPMPCHGFCSPLAVVSTLHNPSTHLHASFASMMVQWQRRLPSIVASVRVGLSRLTS